MDGPPQRPSGRLELFGMERAVEGDWHRELSAAILNRRGKTKPWANCRGLVVELISINLTNGFTLTAEDSKVICQSILEARKVIRDGHV